MTKYPHPQRQALAVQIGRRLRAARERRGISQEAFADLVGFHRAQLGALERGEKNITINTLARLADAYGVPVSRLLA